MLLARWSARHAAVLECAGVVHGCAVAVVHTLVAEHAPYFDSVAVAAARVLAAYSGPAAAARAVAAESMLLFGLTLLVLGRLGLLRLV